MILVMITLGFKMILESMETVSNEKQDIPGLIAEANHKAHFESIFFQLELLLESELRSICTRNGSEGQFDPSFLEKLTAYAVDSTSRYSILDFLVLSHSLGFHMIMNMHEPAIDSGRQEELDRLTKWFDAIRASSEAMALILFSLP